VTGRERLGRLLASGRWSDIYELGPDRVLRRYHDPAGMGGQR
jgi:hypothetical protein